MWSLSNYLIVLYLFSVGASASPPVTGRNGVLMILQEKELPETCMVG